MNSNSLSAVLFAAIIFATATPTTAVAIDLNPFSAIKGAVEAVAEDRSSGDIAKDLEIKATITTKVIDKMGGDVISISADVYEQDVMLTGAVESSALILVDVLDDDNLVVQLLHILDR